MARDYKPYNPNATSPLPFIGMGLLAGSGFCYAATPMFVAWPWIFAALAVWAGLMIQGFRWWTPRPVALLVLGLVAMPLWIVLILVAALMA